MTSPALDVCDFLNAEGQATLGDNLFAFEIDDMAETQIVFIDTEGVESPIPNSYRSLTFQMLVRGEKNDNPINPYNLANQIDEFMVGFGTFEVGGRRYAGGVYQQSGIAYIGRDEEARPVYSANYFVYR